jgi:hypothetical protein
MYVKELVEENIAYLPSVEEVSYRGLMAKSGARTCSHNAERDCTTVCTIDHEIWRVFAGLPGKALLGRASVSEGHRPLKICWEQSLVGSIPTRSIGVSEG